MTTYPLHITDVPYSATKSRLNTLDICLPRALNESPKDAFWVVYIHGGAWRDPLITASSFRPTIDHMVKTNAPVLAQIAGFVSIHYRLSPYPDHPTHPTIGSPNTLEAVLEGRCASHPSHVDDVVEAVHWLQRTYQVGDTESGSGRWNYVLVGHSCGATMALQTSRLLRMADAPQPRGLAGIAGIYDILTFAQNHEDEPMYGDILANAWSGEPIDDDMKKSWVLDSPIHDSNLEFIKREARLRRLVLAQSRSDGLVEWEQVALMEERAKHYFPVRVLEIAGHHDQCWQEGEGVAQTIEALLTGLAEEGK